MSVLALIGAIALAGGAFHLWSNRPGRTAVSVNGRILTARELEWRAQTLVDDAKRVEKLFDMRRERLKGLAGKANSLSPLGVLSRGYAVATKDGKAIKDAAAVSVGDEVEVRLQTGKIKTVVKEK